MNVTSSSNNTPTYWVTNTPGRNPCNPVYSGGCGIYEGRRTASSGLLMNIGYLNGQPPGGAVGGTGTDSELGDELSPLPRPASAGAAAVVSGYHENSVLYDYPPSMSHQSTTVQNNSSRHRGVSLRKQHSVSCASHCCEVAAAASAASGAINNCQPKL